jgi:DNA replication and repair protein RecF
MRLSSVKLRDFRNIRFCEFEPDRGVNLFIGQNAQGKTSILESIGYLSSLRSFRRAKPPELIRNGEAFSEIECRVVSHDLTEADWQSDLKAVFVREGEQVSRAAFVNGKLCTSASQYLSHRAKALGGSFGAGFHAVSFNPSDHEFVRGEPRLRREALNQVLAAEDIESLALLKRYEKVLEQRNAVLKSGNPQLARALVVYDEVYIDLALELTYKRFEWLERLASRLNSVLQRIAPEQPEVQILYGSSWVPKNHSFSFNNRPLDGFHFTGQGLLPSLQDLRPAFLSARESLAKTEWITQSTQLGPHRDDWVLLLEGQPLKARGSQGEVRSTLLALKLCEIELFYERTGLKPVFLLDDFSSELDRVRRKFLLNFILETDLQVFVTSTEKIESMGKHYPVSNGTLSGDFFSAAHRPDVQL